MKQEFNKYTAEDFKVWKMLFERQVINLQDKACKEYLDALETMKPVLNADEVPNFEKINKWFQSSTGWEIECVPGLIPVDEFFQLLAEKRFPSSTWLRSLDKLDYLEEPDMFHDVFGHIPLLCNPVFSKFMQAFGELGVKFIDDEERLVQLQRLYWFTIEFGLMKENGQKKIIGAGIASSFGEAKSSISDEVPSFPFDMETVLNTEFITSEMQSKYFVLENLEELFNEIINLTENWNCHVVERN
jgi:phenylalanine-4-hydroxylase